MKKLLYFLSAGLLLGAAACSKDDDKSYSFSDVTLNVAQDYTIPNGTGTTWESYNDYVATVNGNVVTGVIAGQTQIKSELGSFNVTVVPTNNLFLEPYLKWGASKSEVKKAMNAYKDFSLDDETDEDLTYLGTGKVFMYLYEFSENNKDLDASYMFVDSDQVTSEEFADYMTQRYIYLDVEDDDLIYMASTDFTTVVGVYPIALENDIYYVALYLPVEDSRSTMDVKSFVKSKMVNAKYQKSNSPVAVKAMKELKAEFAK